MTQLTPHFSLDELTYTEHREIDNTAPPDVVENLKRTADLLEQVRVVLNGKPVMVSSGYRCPALNDAVGSKRTSQHMIGCAADFHVSDMTPDEVVQAIMRSTIQFDQLIREFDRWTHISVPNTVADAPRRQVLIIDNAGTRLYS